LIAQRTLPHARGKPGAAVFLPQHLQQHVARLAMAHPFTARELARMVRDSYRSAVDHRGIQRVLAQHQRSPEVLQRQHQRARRAPSPPWPPGHQFGLPCEPTTHAQRLAQALGPEPLLIRCRSDQEYPTDEQARWRIIEWREVGVRPRCVAALLAVDPHVVYHWPRRCKADGFLGLSTRPRERTSISPRVSVQVIMEVLQLLDNHPLLGHYRVQMALDSWGHRYGPTTVWPMVALYKQVHPPAPSHKRSPTPDERPRQATAPHEVWCIAVRYVVKIEGHGLYSSLIFAGYSRALVGAGCFARQNLSRVVQVCRQAIAQWGAPDTVVSDHAGVLLALSPCLQPLGSRWAPIVRGHPWQHLAEGGFSIQRRMLDASVTGCTDRATVYRPHGQCVQDSQFWGHGAHTRPDEQGRLYSVSPEVILSTTKGRMGEASRRRRVFRLRQLTRQVRQHGQIRRPNFGLYVERSLWGQLVQVVIDDEALRIEQADHLLVSYPCVYDTRQRRLTAIDGPGRQSSRQVQVIQLLLWALELARTVWRMPRYRRASWPSQVLQAPQIGVFE
jgi:hypothetical protein